MTKVKFYFNNVPLCLFESIEWFVFDLIPSDSHAFNFPTIDVYHINANVPSVNAISGSLVSNQ